MSGVKPTNERPPRRLRTVDEVDSVDDGLQQDWEPDATDGIPPGNDPGDVLTWDGDSWEPEPPSGGSSTFPWFIVTDPAYGAVGDGSTNDTAAINLAIAALNSAGGGVLYFPHGTYLCSSALTAITVPCVVQGDGAAPISNYMAGTGSNVLQSSATAALFTFSDSGWRMNDIALTNTNGGTPSAGAAIVSATGYFARLDNVGIDGFYDNIDISDGAGWSLNDCFIYDPVRYGIRIRGVLSPDNGDQIVAGCYFMSDSHAGTAAIRLESAGGLKVIGTKINRRTSTSFVDGISVAIPNGTHTGVLTIGDVSIENVTGDAIDISTSGTGSFALITIVGVEVGLYSNNSGRAVKIAAAANGTVGANGSIAGVMIDGCMFHTDGTARAAVELTNTDRVTLGDIQLTGFNARYTSSGDTNTTDGATPSFATPAIVLGTAAAAGAATTVIRSDSTIVAFDGTAPATQAIGDSAATGSAAVAARRDHKHAMPAFGTPVSVGSANAPGSAATVSHSDHVHAGAVTEAAVYGVGGHWEVLMDPATSSPPVPLTTPDGSDWVYGWISDGG